jgi:hypothetical protein
MKETSKGKPSVNKSKKKTTHCSSCGGVFDAGLPNCPFCGTMNVAGAEKQYMDRLGDIHDNLRELSDYSAAETGRQARKTWRWLIWAVVLLLAVGGGIFLHNEMREKAYLAKEKAEFFWQKEAFPEMEALFETSQYEELLRLYEQYTEEGHSLWDFRYYRFCEYMQNLEQAEHSMTDFTDMGLLKYLLADELEVMAMDTSELPEEAGAYLEQRRAPVAEDFWQRFQMNNEDFQLFMNEYKELGYISYSECEQYLKDHPVNP